LKPYLALLGKVKKNGSAREIQAANTLIRLLVITQTGPSIKPKSLRNTIAWAYPRFIIFGRNRRKEPPQQ
jgi:hypothetical protein